MLLPEPSKVRAKPQGGTEGLLAKAVQTPALFLLSIFLTLLDVDVAAVRRQ